MLVTSGILFIEVSPFQGQVPLCPALHVLSPCPTQSGVKWKQLADMATGRGQFGLAMECLHHAEDYGGLLLLATSAGDADTLAKVGQAASTKGYNNISFISNFLLGRLEDCLEILITSGRLPEAAFFARTYLPSQISR